MRLATAAVFAVLIAGCASNGSERQARVASALDEIEGANAYADTEQCLPTYRYDSVEILDDKHLLFEDRNGKDVWLNELRAACPGLRPRDTLAFQMRGSSLCKLDRAEVIERILFWQRTGASCSLGEFHELTEAQTSTVKQALAAK